MRFRKIVLFFLVFLLPAVTVSAQSATNADRCRTVLAESGAGFDEEALSALSRILGSRLPDDNYKYQYINALSDFLKGYGSGADPMYLYIYLYKGYPGAYIFGDQVYRHKNEAYSQGVKLRKIVDSWDYGYLKFVDYLNFYYVIYYDCAFYPPVEKVIETFSEYNLPYESLTRMTRVITAWTTPDEKYEGYDALEKIPAVYPALTAMGFSDQAVFTLLEYSRGGVYSSDIFINAVKRLLSLGFGEQDILTGFSVLKVEYVYGLEKKNHDVIFAALASLPDFFGPKNLPPLSMIDTAFCSTMSGFSYPVLEKILKNYSGYPGAEKGKELFYDILEKMYECPWTKLNPCYLERFPRMAETLALEKGERPESYWEVLPVLAIFGCEPEISWQYLENEITEMIKLYGAELVSSLLSRKHEFLNIEDPMTNMDGVPVSKRDDYFRGLIDLKPYLDIMGLSFNDLEPEFGSSRLYYFGDGFYDGCFEDLDYIKSRSAEMAENFTAEEIKKIIFYPRSYVINRLDAIKAVSESSEISNEYRELIKSVIIGSFSDDMTSIAYGGTDFAAIASAAGQMYYFSPDQRKLFFKKYLETYKDFHVEDFFLFNGLIYMGQFDFEQAVEWFFTVPQWADKSERSWFSSLRDNRLWQIYWFADKYRDVFSAGPDETADLVSRLLSHRGNLWQLEAVTGDFLIELLTLPRNERLKYRELIDAAVFNSKYNSQTGRYHSCPK